MDAGDQEIDQDGAQEDERRKRDAFGKQRQTQTIVRAPQRDPEPIEFMPFRQDVKRQIDHDECGAGRPKPGRSRSQAAPGLGRLQRRVTGIHQRHFHPRTGKHDRAYGFRFEPGLTRYFYSTAFASNAASIVNRPGGPMLPPVPRQTPGGSRTALASGPRTAGELMGAARAPPPAACRRWLTNPAAFGEVPRQWTDSEIATWPRDCASRCCSAAARPSTTYPSCPPATCSARSTRRATIRFRSA